MSKERMQAAVREDNFDRVQLADLEEVATLGTGMFGSRILVQIEGVPERSFVLKKVKKAFIVINNLQQEIMDEKELMGQARSKFIVRLFRTFKDSKYLYLLTESCLGGEFARALLEADRFNEATTRFYTGCVVQALEYLRSRNIVHRDVRPENLFLDNKGYLKLTDFTFAKSLHSDSKTWTFTGNTNYMPPEVIRHQGHGIMADYWSLGVLVFEMLSGRTPFSATNTKKAYHKILKGIDAVHFPAYISTNAKDFIRELCHADPAERLGYHRGGIQEHLWFDRFNWDQLCDRRMTPPIVPYVEDATDTGNLHECDPDLDDPPPDYTTGWDADF